LDLTMAFCGKTNIEDVDRSILLGTGGSEPCGHRGAGFAGPLVSPP
jgi:hypothetical protein